MKKKEKSLKVSKPKKNLPLKKKLIKLLEDDQKMRKAFRKQKGKKHIKVDFEKIKALDKSNQKQLLEIVEKHGWPQFSQVGKKAAAAAFYIIQHASVDLIEIYLPVIKKLAKSGEASPIHAAMMEDRLSMYRGKKQKYGTQVFSKTDDNGKINYFIWPIKNVKKINQIRKSKGFKKNIKQYAKALKATYNPTEALPVKSHAKIS